MAFLTFRVIFLAALAALALGYPSIWLTRRARLVDRPGSAPHKLHQTPIPLAGGFLILTVVLILSAATGVLTVSPVSAILAGSCVAFLFGLVDDVRALPVIGKLAGQLLAAVAVIGLGVQVQLFIYPWLNLALTLVWLLGVTNAFNFVDSMDGLAIGLSGLSAAFFMLVTFDSQQLGLSVLSAVLLGACIGSYYYNAAPARAFLGDSGAQLLGFLLAALAIAYNPVGFSPFASWYVPILLVSVPIFDATLVIISRLRRGRSIYRAARDHTYHRLVAYGFNANHAMLAMHIAALMLGCLAFIALSLPPLAANIVFAACLLAGGSAIAYLDSRVRWS